MKTQLNLTYLIAIVAILECISFDVLSQATSGGFGNVPQGAADYIGWVATSNIPLRIKNEDNQQLLFYTNAGFGTNNNLKMRIGRRMLNGTERGAVMIQETGATNITDPRAILHLGNDYVPGNIGGWRPWLDIGTWNSKGSDFAYFGTMERIGDTTILGGDHNDAVILWGDNENPPDGADNLRFIFSAPINLANSGTAGTYSALEVGRYSPTGRLGIGNFSNAAFGGGSGIQPVRRLEIYGENNDTLLNADAPQLRLTYTPNANVNLGIHTDFETTALGDLFIHPSSDLSGGAINRRVGINTASPTETLEINSNNTSAIPGNSGLVFTDLNSTSTSQSPNGKVLTVDANGKVILTDDIGGNGSVTACGGLTAAHQNFITKWRTISGTTNREICRTEGIFESPTAPHTVGIGVGSTPQTGMQLHVGGNLYLTGAGTQTGDIFMWNGSGPGRILSNYNGTQVLAIGIGAGNADAHAVTSGSTESVYVGTNAGAAVPNNVFGNTFVGQRAGMAFTNVNGINNTILGAASALNFTTGKNNVIIGYYAARGASNSLTSGDDNIYIGSEVQNNSLVTGTGNVVLGKWASVINNNSSSNPSNYNILIGAVATANDNNGWSATPNEIVHGVAIGANSLVNCDSCLILGNRLVHRIGIGRTTADLSTILDVDPRSGMAWAAIFRDTAIQVNTVHVASDQMLKDQVVPLENISDLLNTINVYSYRYKREDYPQIGIDGGFHYGFMAQEVEQSFPGIVSLNTASAMLDSTGTEIAPSVDYKTISYLEMIPLLFQGFKEQKHIIDSLSQVVAQCCVSPLIIEPPANNRSSLVLSNKDIVILNQNSPNPFNESTEISYQIPESVKNAIIMFYDHSGKVLQKFEISHRGAGSLTVYSEDLTSGIYSYTLIIDGKNHETKRMMKQ